MHAIRQHAFGPAENLVYEELPDLVPGADQVRIAVEASGVHLLDTFIRQGVEGGPFPRPDLPMIPGREVAGTVDEVGPGVGREWLGKRVVAHLGMASGGYADQAVAAVTSLHEIPGDLGADVAVAAIGTGRTAAGILDVAELTGDDVVLITAAAGGLGSLFLQAATNAGALAVGVAGGAAKVEQVASLGAKVAVDYTEADWTGQVQRALGDQAVTLVLDGVGGAIGRGGLDLLGIGGRLVMFGNASGELIPFTSADVVDKGLTVTWVVGPRMLRRAGGLRPLETRALADAAAGRLVPVVGRRFPLAEAAAAHRAMESRATTGKVVLVSERGGLPHF